MFVDLLLEIEPNQIDVAVEAFTKATGEAWVKLLYKYIWTKLKAPSIEDFGKRFFHEVCDVKF